jgi:hypothetical protein
LELRTKPESERGARPEFRRARSETRRASSNPTEAKSERTGPTGRQLKAQPTGDAVREHERKAGRHERSPELAGAAPWSRTGWLRSGTARETRHGRGRKRDRAAKPSTAGTHADRAAEPKARCGRRWGGPRNRAWCRVEVGGEVRNEAGAGAGDRRAWPGRLVRAWKRAGGRPSEARRELVSIGRLD